MILNGNETLNSAIKKMADGSKRAGSIMVLLQRAYPGMELGILKELDEKGLYGDKMADMYFIECKQNLG